MVLNVHPRFGELGTANTLEQWWYPTNVRNLPVINNPTCFDGDSV